MAKFREKLRKIAKYLIKICVPSLPHCIKPIRRNCWKCPINTPKLIFFDKVMTGRLICLFTSIRSSRVKQAWKLGQKLTYEAQDL